MEKEKEFRTKFQSQQKSHSDIVDSLQVRVLGDLCCLYLNDVV